MNRIVAPVSLPPTTLVLFSIVSMQLGAAFAKSLFPQVGAAGMVLMRVGFAAIILFVLQRPKWTAQTQQHFKTLIAFGVVLSLMNLSFYAAIDRIPLGIAVTLEFTGPLGLAALHSQRWLDGLWIILAATGVLLLMPIAGFSSGFSLDAWGIAFALIAALLWAIYIVLSAQVAKAVSGIDGLVWAMAIGAVLLTPIGIASAGNALLQPKLLAMGFGVAILSSALPYSLELLALKSMPIRVFGVLKSLEPMSAAIAGLFVLKESLTLQTALAIGLVSLAAAGTSRFQQKA